MPESAYFFFKRWNLFMLFRLYYVHADSTLINCLFAMEKCLQDEIVKNLKNIYTLRELPLPPSYVRYIRLNCEEDFVKLAPNPRFRKFIAEQKPFADKYLEFKRLYHTVLINSYKPW